MKQSQALDILKMGENVFLTGRAGAGKTFVLNQYIKYLKSRGISTAITASTGIAATHLNGTTIHSWSGIGIKDRLTDRHIDDLLQKKYLRRHYLETSVLIIDEVSMLHAHQLDMVNQLAQIFRQNLRPFGGMQVVLSGDFFQLPPVSDNGEAKMVTESEIWDKAGLRICYLDEQWRQDDKDFLNILNEIRAGSVSQRSRDLLNTRIEQPLDFKLEPTKLYTHNADVDAINAQELAKITNQTWHNEMTFKGNENVADMLRKSCLAPENLKLKIGAKVMFVKNDFDKGVVNGTLGVVVGFDDETSYPIVEIASGDLIDVEPTVWVIAENEKIVAQIKQFPLRLAWAITVHKSQGMSLDLAEIDLSGSFTYGMGYVALSRVRSLAGLRLKGINEMAFEVDPKVLPLDKKLWAMSEANVKMLTQTEAEKVEKRKSDFAETNASRFRSMFGSKKKPKTPNHLRSLEYLKQGLSIKETAEKMGFVESTIMNHIFKIIEEGRELNIDYLMPEQEVFNEIENALEVCGPDRLRPVYEYLEERYDFDLIKLVRLKLLQ